MLKRGLIVFVITSMWTLNCMAGPLHIRVLDVGEGQAVLLHQNQRAVLIDTAHAGKARGVLQRMKELGIKSLDYLFLTHLHPDHASGYFRVVEEFPSVQVRDNCQPVNGLKRLDMIRWVDEALQLLPQRSCLITGDEIKWADTEINVLWPLQKPAAGDNLNHASLVLEVMHHGQRLLVMGDADVAAERELLKRAALVRADILIVGHHGAGDATSDALIRAVEPEKSVISINRNNLRGYPSSDVIKRLRKAGSEVFTTYEHGELHFVFEE